MQGLQPTRHPNAYANKSRKLALQLQSDRTRQDLHDTHQLLEDRTFYRRRQYTQEAFWRWERGDYRSRVRAIDDRSYPPSSWPMFAEAVKKWGGGGEW